MHGTLAALILLRPAGRRQAAPASPIGGIDTGAAPASDGRRGQALAITVKRLRFTVEQYHRLGEAGILGEDVELIGGQIVEIHRAPSATGYRDVRVLTRDDVVTPRAFPDVAITPADVLG